MLVYAVATRSGRRFIERLGPHLAGVLDPVEAIVEALSYMVEWLPTVSAVLLVFADDLGRTSFSASSELARQFGRGVLAETDIDCTAIGFDDVDMDKLTEYVLRILVSLMIDPGGPPRTSRGSALPRAGGSGPSSRRRSPAMGSHSGQRQLGVALRRARTVRRAPRSGSNGLC